jgi:UDP-N-acetylmuramoylalanine--D-glutamate ligase
MNHGEKPQMIGDHNLDNLGLSYATASYLKWPEASFKEMLLFPGLPHRLENCGIHRGILFLNDSKATAIASVIEAAHAVQNEKSQSGKIHMLLGGRDKNLPWENLSILKNSRFLFHFFGEFGEMAQKKSGLSGTLSQDLHSCLNQITSQLSQRDIVLLSPGGTSLDEFKGFEDRGNYFKRWVLSEFNH